MGNPLLIPANVHRLLGAADDAQHRALVEVAYAVGLTPEEAVNLTVEGFDRESDTLRVRRRGHERVVPLPWKAADALRAWVDAHPTGTGALFRSTDGAGPMPRSYVYRVLERLGKAAGVGPVSPSDLREATVEHLRIVGASDEDVRRLLGVGERTPI